MKMDPVIPIDEYVRVVTDTKVPRKDSLCTPLCMFWRGRRIDFIELGLHHPTSAGKRMVHVFDVTDGECDYRLEFDAETLIWKLKEILGEHYEATPE